MRGQKWLALDPGSHPEPPNEGGHPVHHETLSNFLVHHLPVIAIKNPKMVQILSSVGQGQGVEVKEQNCPQPIRTTDLI